MARAAVGRPVAPSDGSFSLTGGAGSDDLGGGAQDDLFDLRGGDDGSGGTGSDTCPQGRPDGRRRITGGSSLGDNDVVKLAGNYSGGLAFNATTMVQIEKIELAALHSYTLATDDATVSGGQTLKVDGSALGASDSLTFDGHLETSGKFDVVGGAAGDTLTGGSQDDAFDLGHGGNDTVGGGGGDDVLDFGATLTDQDIIDGGSGTGDAVQIAGYYASGGLGALGLSAMTNVERLVLGNGVGFDYVISTVDATVAAGATLTIDATALSAQQSLSFDGSAESDGSFLVKSGGGSDDLTGGAQGDIFGYLGIALSSATRDTINNFDFGNDVIKFAAVTGIDAAVTAGQLDSANFDGDLAAIFGSGGSQPLGAQHAVLFTADSGTESGHTFLIVDGNDTAGYDAGADLIIRLNGYSGTMDAGDFMS